MMTSGRLVLAAAAMPFEYDKARNLERCCHMLERAAAAGANLVLLPEQIVQGYLPTIRRFDSDAVAYQHAHAEPVPGGASVERLTTEARRLGLYAVVGLTECADDEGAAVLYNTAVLLGPDGYIGKYRKIHQPGCEALVYWPGKELRVFDLPIGSIGVLICYDKWFAEPVLELALLGADIVLVMSATSLERPGSPPERDYLVDTYALVDRMRAFENQVWLVTSNVVGRCGDEEYFGQARIVGPDGTVVAETKWMEEGLAVATVDVRSGLIKARACDPLLGVNLLRDRRPQTYRRVGRA